MKKNIHMPDLSLLFIICISALWLLWAAGLSGGSGEQLNVFFKQCEDFMADFVNVVRYSAERDPYGNTLNHAAEHAYPPMSYIFYYLTACILPEGSLDMELDMWKQPRLMMIILLSACFVSSVFFIEIYMLKKGSRAVKFLTALSVCMTGLFMFTAERGNSIMAAAVLCNFFSSAMTVRISC